MPPRLRNAGCSGIVHHRQLTLMQLVAAPVVRQGRIVAVGQDGSRWHRSVLHAPGVTTGKLTIVARHRQCLPLDTPEYIRSGELDSIADCRRPEHGLWPKASESSWR